MGNLEEVYINMVAKKDFSVLTLDIVMIYAKENSS